MKITAHMIAIAAALALSIVLVHTGSFLPGGARPPIVRMDTGVEPDHIYFDPSVRILPRAWRSRIAPVPPARFLAETTDEEPCREVMTTSLQADETGEGWDQNEVSLAVHDGRIVVTFNDDNVANAMNSVSGYSFSDDGGASFTDGGAIVPAYDYFGGGDPVVVADPADPDHFLYLQLTYNVQMNPTSYAPSSIVLSHSLDGGRTFPTDQSVDILQGKRNPEKPNEPAVSGKGFHDKEWMSFDPATNTVLVSWSFFYQQLDFSYQAFPAVIVSHDGGATFEDPVNPAPSGVWGGLVCTATGPGGELYVVFNDFQASRLLFVRSFDGGASWDPPVDVTGLFQQPGFMAFCGYASNVVLNGNIRITSIPSMAVDPVTGEIYIVYNFMPDSSNPDAQNGYDPSVDYSDVAFVRSSDRGATWTTPVRINDDDTASDQFMPWVATAGDGNVAVMFYDRRDDPANMLMNIYVARSFDGGRTWLRNSRVTCTSFTSAANGGCYMGDYNQMVTDGNDYYLAWGDNRNLIDGTPQADVYFIRLRGWPHRRPFAPAR